MIQLGLLLSALVSVITAGASCDDLLITPEVVALARDGESKLRPVRRLPNEFVESHINGQGDKWDYARESVVVPLRLRHDVRHAQFGGSFNWLPTDVRETLARGVRFETTAATETADPKYSLWMVAPPEGSRRRGRTGVMLRHGRPIVVQNPATGAEYLIELKGPGLPDGGYAESPHYRALQGGLWERQGQTEFERLNDLVGDQAHDSVKAVAYQRFAGAFGGQEILFRLTPGNLRASLRGTDSLRRTPEQTDALMRSVGERTGEVIAGLHFAYTHPENFVVNATGEMAWATDLLDVLPLRRLPRRVEGVAMDEPRALVSTLGIVRLFTSYQADRHWPIFWSSVLGVLSARALIVPERLPHLKGAHDVVEATLGLLRGGLAERIVRDRQAHGYDPLDDPDVARAVAAGCEPPDALDHGHRLVAFLESLPLETEGHSLAPLRQRLVLEAERLARGEIGFRDWVTSPMVSLFVTLNGTVNLDHGYVAPGEEGFSFVRIMTGNAFPGWFEFKRHLEREHRLFTSALDSHPNDPDLKANLAAIGAAADWLTRMDLVELIDVMCVKRDVFRRKFKLPYHR